MGNFETAPFSYPYSIRPMNQKAWIDVKSPRFSYLQPIQYLVVMEFRAKPLLSPTYMQNKPPEKIADIRHIHSFSQSCDHLNVSALSIIL
jgi:hypothetical protein